MLWRTDGTAVSRLRRFFQERRAPSAIKTGRIRRDFTPGCTARAPLSGAVRVGAVCVSAACASPCMHTHPRSLLSLHCARAPASGRVVPRRRAIRIEPASWWNGPFVSFSILVLSVCSTPLALVPRFQNLNASKSMLMCLRLPCVMSKAPAVQCAVVSLVAFCCVPSVYT